MHVTLTAPTRQADMEKIRERERNRWSLDDHGIILSSYHKVHALPIDTVSTGYLGWIVFLTKVMDFIWFSCDVLPRLPQMYL